VEQLHRLSSHSRWPTESFDLMGRLRFVYGRLVRLIPPAHRPPALPRCGCTHIRLFSTAPPMTLSCIFQPLLRSAGTHPITPLTFLMRNPLSDDYSLRAAVSSDTFTPLPRSTAFPKLSRGRSLSITHLLFCR